MSLHLRPIHKNLLSRVVRITLHRTQIAIKDSYELRSTFSL